MKKNLGLSIILLSCLSAGCATQANQARLAISSVPEGANITDSITGEDYGVAPVIVYYDAADIRPDSEGCFYLNGIDARWVSGATEQTESLSVCGSTTGIYQITIGRPSSYPGLEQDMERALQIQQERAEAQARADRIRRDREQELARRAANRLPDVGNGTGP
jgi:hypothetical protein